MTDPITKEVRALARLDLEGLRDAWRRRYGPPPKARSQELLRLSLAWRIQSEVFGGLDVVTRRRLRQSPGAPARPDHLGVAIRIGQHGCRPCRSAASSLMQTATR